MIKENCLIWGIGNLGNSRVLVDMLENRYNVVAYCDNNSDGKTKVNKKAVIPVKDMKTYVCENNIAVILIAVSNREAEMSIRNQIQKEISGDIKVFGLHDNEMDRIENEYIANKFNHLQFEYNIDFIEQSKEWVENLMSEVMYWLDRYSETDGAFIDSYIQNESFLTYYPEYEEFSRRLCNGDEVMDIGSGIISKFGCLTELGSELQVLAIDPLAYYYNQLLPKEIPEKKRCRFGLFELIANFYKKESADGIMINNALDHCIDPFKAIVECLYILKPDKYICTLHRRAEAVWEKYTGLHKWNIDYNSKDHLIIWNESNAIDVTEALETVADIKLSHSEENATREKQMILVEIRKKQSFELEEFLDMCKERESLAMLVERLMKYYAETDTSDILTRLRALRERENKTEQVEMEWNLHTARIKI